MVRSKMFGRPKGRLKPVGHVDLFEDVVDVGLYRVGADAKRFGNLVVGRPNDHHLQNFALSGSQNGALRVGWGLLTLIQDTPCHQFPGKPQLTEEYRMNTF